uniref:T9SS type A sorting domain-containing protein n=1 Tax=Flavisolibacter nicotianae TaxID=2364882 RepID=UPI000EB23AF0
GSGSPVTPRLQKVLGFTAGPTKNDTTQKTTFPYVQTPWRGFTGAQYVGSGACTPPTFLNDRTIVLDASCGSNDGNISLIPKTGTAPFLYSIDGGTTYVSGPNAGYTFMSLAPGTYKLRLKDGNGCESKVVEKVVHSVFYGTPFLNDRTIVLDASCGSNDGAISIIPTNGTAPFQYSIDGGATYVSGPASGYTFQNLKAGTYQLRLKDSRSCESYVVVRDVRPDAYGPCAVNSSPLTARPHIQAVSADRDVLIQAYPNPSRGKFRLHLKNVTSPTAQISILDDKGRLLQNKLVNTREGNAFDFDLSKKAKGVYLIRVVSDKGVQLSKIVIL